MHRELDRQWLDDTEASARTELDWFTDGEPTTLSHVLEQTIELCSILREYLSRIIPDELLRAFVNCFLAGDIEMAENEIDAVRNLAIEFVKVSFALGPCPFAHFITGEHRIEIRNESSGEWSVGCSCDAEMWNTLPTLAIDMWNERAATGICPWCGNDDDDFCAGYFGEKYQIECANTNCNSYGPRADTDNEAERLWKNRSC